MDMKNKTCLFCLKQRQILVDNPYTANAIKNIYSINLPKDRCRFCAECHFNILRVREFKRTIEAAADFDVDSCFVCKSENTVNEPGVDRVVGYLTKQCTTIDFGNTDTIKACVTCMHVLETCIKYEKLARNYARAKQFCKQYSSLKECNVALQKIDLNALGGICEGFDDGGGKCQQEKKNRKRGRSSVGEEVPSKKSKQEEGSVLPVMLTKLTPTGGKKSSPPNVFKPKSLKQSDKIFIKLPLFSKTKKKLQQRKKHGSPNLLIRSIPASPSVDDLNRIFGVELRSLSVRIEHIDLSSYLNKTISHDTANRQLRKPNNEEFIGLDEEDVVELQNTNMNSSISKRKSILITERTESPNSAKKKVKFSDSPSIKYVDKLDFSEEENGTNVTDDGEKDHDLKKSNKKTPKPPNGTSPVSPENGKPRSRGRPKKITKVENEKDDQEHVHSSEAETAPEDTISSKKTDENISKVVKEAEAADGEIKRNKEEDKDEKETEQTSSIEKIEPLVDKEAIELNEVPVENGDVQEQKTESSVQPSVIDKIQSSHEALNAAPMEADDADDAEPMKVDQNDDTDAEMKPIDSPEDVEMTESKSPPTEDVEMKEIDGKAAELADSNAEATSSLASPIVNDEQVNTIPTLDEGPSLNQQNAGDFEVSDKEEEEMEKFKLNLCSLLGDEILDSDHDASQQSHGDKKSNSTAEKANEEPDTVEDSKPTQKDEQQINSLNIEAQTTPSVETLQSVPDTESPSKITLSFSSLDDVDDISDDDDILNQLDEPTGFGKRSPDLPPLGEDSL